MVIKSKEEIIRILSMIAPADESKYEEAYDYQEALVKPPGSLGSLEDISIKLAGITGDIHSRIDKTAVAIFSADNGVTVQGVASAPQDVTYVQTINFTRRLTGAGAIAETFGTDLLVIDVGGAKDYPDALLADEIGNPITDKILDRKIAYGTKDFSEGPAMTEEQVITAIGTGIEAAKGLKDAGYDVFGIGEMGIGNTSTSAAVLSYLTDLSSDETVGKGGGVNKAGFLRKKEIVDESIKRIVKKDDAFEQIVEVFRQVGGFDIAAMAGAYLGAAAYKLPVVIDGYISAVAALCACRINPAAKEYMFASHQSKEPGYLHAINEIGLVPMFNLGMRLGEGSGCPIAFQIMKAACGVMNGMATFEESRIDTGYLEELDRKEDF